MNRKNFVLSGVIIWLICVSSMVGVHFILNGKPSRSAFGAEAKAVFQNLDDITKNDISLYEAGIIKLEDGTLRIIGSGYQTELDMLLAENRLAFRKIEFRIENPLIFERAMMVGQAFKTLNNSEKQMFSKGYASVIFQNGTYGLYFDPRIYQQFVGRYGTGCKSCDDKADISQNN